MASLSEQAQKYVDDALAKRLDVPVYVRHACERWKAWKKQKEYRPGAVDRVGRMIRSLPCPEGAFGNFDLMPWQAFVLSVLFGFHEPNGERSCRELLLVVPRKAGKSSLLACVGLVNLVEPAGGAKSPRIMCCGITDDAAMLTYNKARSIVASDLTNDAKRCFSRLYKLRATKNAISCKRTNGIIDVLTFGASNLEGHTPNLVVVDEISRIPNTQPMEVMRTSFGATWSPQMVMTTTPSDLPYSVYDEELQKALRWLELDRNGEPQTNNSLKHLDRYFAMLYMATMSDEPGDRKIWYRTQPSLGNVVSEAYYEDQWQSAQYDERAKHGFRTRLLCTPAKMSGSWVSIDDWEKLDPPPEKPKKYRDWQTFIGLDLSDSRDMTAIAVLQVRKGGSQQRLWVECYYPRGSMPDTMERKGEQTTEDLVHEWVRDGWLIVQESPTIDHILIAQRLNELVRELRPVLITCDQYNAVDDVRRYMTDAAKGRLRIFTKNAVRYTSPISSLSSWVVNRTLQAQQHGVLKQHIMNAIVEETKMGGRIVTKESKESPAKIDSLDALLTAIGAYLATSDITTAGQQENPVVPDQLVSIKVLGE